jgi:hypothetical protein
MTVSAADDHVITAADPSPTTSTQPLNKINSARLGAH